MQNEKSEDQATIESGASVDNFRGSSIPRRSIFASFLSKQSLPRILGLLVGNTRDLEQRLSDKEKEINYLKSQVEKWQDQCIAFQDSSLLAKGMKPTSNVGTQHSNASTTQVNTKLPGENLVIEGEIDRLKETWRYRPNDLKEEIDDLLATNTPRNKMIVERFTAYLESLPEDISGVTILQ